MASEFYRRLRLKTEELMKPETVVPEGNKRGKVRDILSLLGGVLLVAGVLFFAKSHWHEYSPGTRLILAFLPFGAAALFGFWAIVFAAKRLPKECAALSCGLSALLCVITVSAECYNPHSLQMTAELAVLLFLPFIYIFCGTALAVTASFLLSWLIATAAELSIAPLLFFCLLPFVIGRIIVRPASASARWGQGASLALLAAWSIRYYSGEYRTVSAAVYCITLFSLLLVFGRWWKQWDKGNLFVFFGKAAWIVFTACASFPSFWRNKQNAFNLKFNGITAAVEIIVLFLCAVFLVWAFRSKKGKKSAFSLLLFLPLVLLIQWFPPELMAYLMAFGFIAFAVRKIFRALKERSVSGILGGELLLTALLIAHGLKSDKISLIVSGVIFILWCIFSGGALIVAKWYFKKHPEKESER